jgi:hypothetical protein
VGRCACWRGPTTTIYIPPCGDFLLDTKPNTTTVACRTGRRTYHGVSQHSAGDMSAVCSTPGIDSGCSESCQEGESPWPEDGPCSLLSRRRLGIDRDGACGACGRMHEASPIRWTSKRQASLQGQTSVVDTASSIEEQAACQT